MSMHQRRDPETLLAEFGWHEWLCHTNFSFLVGASHPQEYLQRASQLGYAGLAVTDFDGAYGLARSHTAWRQLASQGEALRLFHGAEIHFTNDHDLPVCCQDTLALVARSRVGYGNMCRLLTYSHRHGKDYAHVPLTEFLRMPVNDLVAIQPMRGLVRRSVEELRQRLRLLKEVFADRLYVAISRHLNPAEDVWITPTLAVARELAIPCILSQDAFFHEPKQKDMSDLLHAIRTNLSLGNAVPHMFVNGERCLHSLPSLARLYQDLPIYASALRHSRELAESCSFNMSELRYHYPKEMIPAGHTAQSFLAELTWKEAESRFGSPLSPRIADTLSHELRLIEDLKFADYFLTVWDIVRWARQQNILCQGRGSAANSAVCFVLGITAVDPSKFDLLFERFVSMERGDPPDIDVDFEHERREEVIQYIYSRYGRARAAMVANVITFRQRGALRAVSKAFGLLAEVDNPGDHIVTLAERLEGFPRHLGIHSGGFVLSDVPLDTLVPQEPATMEGRSVIQWCKDDIEALGFFKVDVLALGMLTAIRKSFAAIESHYGRSLTLATIPDEDPATYAMIQRADTVGTFQIESRAQMSMLPRLRPRTFYDLVIEVAIIRPGPIQGGMIHPYLKRREGLEEVKYPDERLRPILARTLGIPLFQEQVMRIAIAVGDFTPGEANELRRHMGSWTLKGDMSPWLKKLAAGMKKNGLSEEFTQAILAQMRGFADYGFPESHSVSFALLAYASSWLKRHYPGAFFMSLLNSQPMGFYSAHALLQSAQRDGVKVLPICAQRSVWDSTLERVDGPGERPRFGIRLGLRLVAGLRKAGAQALVSARELEGGFRDLEHLLKTANLYRADLTALAAADAFQVFGIGRKSALWLAEAAPFLSTLEDEEEVLTFAPESAMERIQQDFAATGTSLGPHPAVVIRNECWCYEIPSGRVVSAVELQKIDDGKMVQVFGMVLVRQAPPSANGMVFLTLEDETGFINLAFTPQIFERYSELVERQTFLCVRARVQRRNESHSLMVAQVYEPKISRADVIPLTTSVVRPESSPPPAADAVQVILAPQSNYM